MKVFLAGKISIHAAREGGDHSALTSLLSVSEFQSTPPVKAATIVQVVRIAFCPHFNPRRP